MHALIFNIRLLEPLLIRQPGNGEENSGTGAGFIPGGVLRGYLINQYMKQHQVGDPVADGNCRRLFFDGAVCYLNGYPQDRLGRRGLPRPLSWHTAKDDTDNQSAAIYDLAVEPCREIDSPKPPKGEFCWQYDDEEDEPKVELASPARFVSLHNTSNNRNVKRKEDSTVYRYEAIASDQIFQAVIVADKKEDLEVFIPMLDRVEAVLGGSHSAGYGRVRFEKPHLESAWQEYESGDPPDDIVIITLLSDAILRSESGQISPHPSNLLGVKPESVFQRVRLVGGFSRKWGLPLPQASALQAGSVFVYRAADLAGKDLLSLEREGVGERRTEGFGRLAVNWHTRSVWKRRRVDRRPETGPVSLSEESRFLAQKMAERLLRAELEQKLLAAVNRLEIKPSTESKNAQIARLRLALRRAWQEEDLQVIGRHLDNLKKAAREQFARARIEGKALERWLREMVVCGDGLWEVYLKPNPRPAVAGVSAEISEALKIEFTVRLLDGLLKKAAGNNQQTGGESTV